VEKFWEKKGLKSVTVRWFYHPEEAKTGKKSPSLKSLKYPVKIHFFFEKKKYLERY